MKVVFGVSVLGGLVMFMWGFVFWALSGIPNVFMNGVENQVEVQQFLDQQLDASGLYLIPWSDEGPADPTFIELHQQGPIVEMFFIKDGFAPMSGLTMFWGFLHMVLSSALGLVLAGLALKPDAPYRAKFAFFCGLGIIGAFYVDLGPVIWFHRPLGYQGVTAFYDIGSWVFAGALMAKLFTPFEMDLADWIDSLRKGSDSPAP